MDSHPGFTSIFHPTDFSLASEVAFAHALKLALAAKAELRVVHYVEEDVDVEWECFPKVKETLMRWGVLSSTSSTEDMHRLGLRVNGIVAKGGDVFTPIFRHWYQQPADLLVLATHQIDGLNRWLYKPVAEPLARHASRPTLFVPAVSDGWVAVEDGAVTLERILIPLTLTPAPQPAIEKAADLARLLGVENIEGKVFHAGHDADMPSVKFPAQEGWKWEKVVSPGHPVDGILELADEFRPNLVVMMTEGHKGLRDMLFGSTTERVLRGVRCPVLAIPVKSS
jgi:nucleotide-binding universal stress UspA family protein